MVVIDGGQVMEDIKLQTMDEEIWRKAERGKNSCAMSYLEVC